MTDFRTIAYRPSVRFTPNHTRHEFMLSKAFLETELSKSFDGPTVVVTHHLPSLRSVPTRFKNDVLSAAYASDLDTLVERSGAALWAHGHTHDAADYRIGGTRVVCNPRGYYGIRAQSAFRCKSCGRNVSEVLNDVTVTELTTLTQWHNRTDPSENSM